MLTGNKGEWSEIYAHLRLMADGKLYSGNENLQKIASQFLDIAKILRREDKDQKDNIYQIDNVNKKVILLGNQHSYTVSQQEINEIANKLLHDIKSIRSEKSSFALSDIENFISILDMHKLKAKSIDKSDMRMVLHDIETEQDAEMGFSVKSKLGGKSTLVNANKDSTNFLFSIEGNITDTQINILNELADTKEKRRAGFFF